MCVCVWQEEGPATPPATPVKGEGLLGGGGGSAVVVLSELDQATQNVANALVQWGQHYYSWYTVYYLIDLSKTLQKAYQAKALNE